MGLVFLGRSPGGRPVAVKLVRPELASDAGFRRRFADEVTAARRVGGFYTAQVVDADPDGDPPWLVTAYVAGPSLHEAIQAHGPLPAAAVGVLGAGLAEGLMAVHSCDLVHRDLKPGNVILAADGPRVIDFGIARALDATHHTSSIVGTPAFMSPEQGRGDLIGPQSDVFSLGSVLAFAATGRNPFGTGPSHAIIYRIVHDHPDLTGLPGQLANLVGACLAKAPADRPALSAVLDHLTDGDHPTQWLPPAITTMIAERGADTRALTGSAEPGENPPPSDDHHTPQVKPEVRELAARLGVDLAAIDHDGDSIGKADVLDAAKEQFPEWNVRFSRFNDDRPIMIVMKTRCLKQPGDVVAVDEPLLEVSTALGDDFVIRSPATGVLTSISPWARKDTRAIFRPRKAFAVIHAATALPEAKVTTLGGDLAPDLATVEVKAVKSPSMSKRVWSSAAYILSGLTLQIGTDAAAAHDPGPIELTFYVWFLLCGFLVVAGLEDLFRISLSEREAITLAIIVAGITCIATISYALQYAPIHGFW